MDRQVGIAITSMEEKLLSQRIVCATAILFNLGSMWNFADYIKTLTRKEIFKKRLNREHCHLKDIKLCLSDSCHNFPLYHDYDLPVHGHDCDVLHL